MKRRLVKLVVFLLLGAIVNVAVAWGCAVLVSVADAPRVSRGVETTHRGKWEVFRIRHFGTDRVESFLFQREIPKSDESVDQVLPRWCADDPQRALETMGYFPGDRAIFEARGWPLVSISHELNIVNGRRAFHESLGVGLADFDGKPQWPRQLPLRPIWPGFAINTVFYAVILWVLFAAPFALRRRRRIRRGLCPACAYPVGDSPVCTECGKALIKQKA